MFVPTISVDHARILALVCVGVGVGGIASAVLFGMVSYAIIGSYAAVALLAVPIYQKLIETGAQDPSSITVSPNVWILLGSAGLIAGSVTAWQSPRPRMFFVATSIVLTAGLGAALTGTRSGLALGISSIGSVLMHLATTATSVLWVGSADAGAMIVGIRASLQSNHIETVAGYHLFPNYFSLATLIGKTASLTGSSTMAVIGSFGMVSLILATYMITRRIGIVPPTYAAVPSALLPFMYEFWYVSTYSVPRTVLAQVVFIPLAVMLTTKTTQGAYSTRARFLLAIMLISLLLFHKSKLFWVLALVIIFSVGRKLLTHLDKQGKNSENMMGVTLLASLMTIGWSYLMIESGLINYLILRIGYTFEAALGIGSQAAPKSGAVISNTPVALLLSLAGSSLILWLFIGGVLSLFQTSKQADNPRGPLVVGAAIISAPFYFPGPVHIINALFNAIEVQRFTEILPPLIAIVSGIGIVKLWMRSDVSVRVIILVLLIVSGTFTLSSDIYSRDNPIQFTGTFTNYVEEDGYAGVQFAEYYFDEAIVNTKVSNYLNIRHGSPRTVKGSTLNPIPVNNRKSFCSVPVLFDIGELTHRGHILYQPITINNDNISSIKSQIYSSGQNAVLVGECRLRN